MVNVWPLEMVSVPASVPATQCRFEVMMPPLKVAVPPFNKLVPSPVNATPAWKA